MERYKLEQLMLHLRSERASSADDAPVKRTSACIFEEIIKVGQPQSTVQ